MMRTNRILTTFRRLLVLTTVAVVGSLAANAVPWDGSTPSSLADAGITGTGVAGDPYVIKDARGFAYFGSVMKNNTSHWELDEKLRDGEEIDLGGNMWTYGCVQDPDNSPAYFFGTFDGHGVTIKNFTVPTDNYVWGGLFCGIAGTVRAVTIDNARLTDGNKWGSCYFGILSPIVNGGTVEKCQVKNSRMTFTGTLSLYGSTVAIGGLVGIVANDNGVISDSKVVSTRITTGDGDCTGTFIFIGGVAGEVYSTGSLKKCAASSVNIKALVERGKAWDSGYSAAHVAVGGVVGDVMQPCTVMPEDLCAYNCKLYAPFASVGPVAGVFIRSTGITDNTPSDDYSAENTTVSTANRQKTASWIFNGYELGLSDAVRNHHDSYTLNVTNAALNNLDTEDGIGYLRVGDPATTMPKNNRVGTSARQSRTVLWYTQNNGREQHNGTAQGIYPSYGTVWTSYPEYYSYFMQGYNVGTYVSSEQANSFVESVAKVSKLSKLTLADQSYGQRGIGEHTITATLVPGDEPNVTLKWYVDGVEKTGTATANGGTCQVAPKYSGAVTITVMASDGGAATLSIPRAYLPTLNSPHLTDDKQTNAPHMTTQQGTIVDDNKDRGKESNPYVISTEEELRLWSELSRLPGTIENGVNDKGEIILDDAEHFNTSHFLLECDVEFANHDDVSGLSEKQTFRAANGTYITQTYTGDQYKMRHGFDPAYHFEPICGFTNEQIYNRNHVFRGVFDGQAHRISGLRQIWKGGTLDMDYAERGTQNWGLFGCVGGDEKNRAVIKNFIIQDAKFEHDVYNGSFLYATAMNNASRNANDTRGTNVAVGVVAGMVTNYTTISNIDVKGCAIYASCVDYYCSTNAYCLIDLSAGAACYRLWVGGAIGRAQAAFDNPRGDIGGTIDINRVSVNVDIDVFPIRLKGTSWTNLMAPDNNITAKAKRFMFNQGGIIGSMYSSGNWSSLPWPEQVFFTGQLRGMSAMSGPVFGFVNYGAMTENINDVASVHQHWIGYPGAIKTGYYNNYFVRQAGADENRDENGNAQGGYYSNPNDAAVSGKGQMLSHATAGMLWQRQASANANNGANTQLTNAFVRDGGRFGNGGKLFYLGPITPSSPDSPLFDCEYTGYSGVRSIVKHEENGLTTLDDHSGRFQGINQGVWKDWTSAENQDGVVADFDADAEYLWTWDAQTGRPVLTSKSSEHLDATLNQDGNEITAELQGVDPATLPAYTYAWYDKCNDETPVQDFKAAGGETNGDVLRITDTKSYDRFYYAVAKMGTEGTDGYKFFKSKVVIVPGTLKIGDVKAVIDSVVTHVPATSYTSHKQYVEEVRITQAQYYALPESLKIKEPATYYAPEYAGGIGFNAYYHDLTWSLQHYGYNVGENTYSEWTDPIPEGYPQTEEAFNALYESDPTSPFLIRTPAVLYSYEEYKALDSRTGTYDASAPNYGFTYAFGGDTSSPYAGQTYVNRNVTPEEFANLSDEQKNIQAKVRTTLTVELTPTAAELIDDGYIVNYQWYAMDGEMIKGENRATLEIDNLPDANSGAYECHVEVIDRHFCNDKVLYRDILKVEWGETYIYINPDNTEYDYFDYRDNKPSRTGVGNDTNDGLTPQTPVASWPVAYSLLKENGTWNENLIILIGKSDQTKTREAFGLGTQSFNGNSTTGTYEAWLNRATSKYMNRNVTITSKRRDGSEFSGSFVMENASGNGTQLALFGDTRFENLVFTHETDGGSGYGIIACQYHNLEMGKGLKMKGFPSASSASAEVGPLPGTKIADLQIFGGCNNDARFVRMDGSVSNYEVDEYVPHPEGFTITVKSGFYSNICASGRQSTNSDLNGIVGTPRRPIKCKIVVDIDRDANNANKNYGSNNSASYDVGAVMAGNHEGAQYGDVDIVIRSGIIGRVTSGSLGNKRLAGNFGTSNAGFRTYKSYYGTTNDEYMPYDTYFGRCNILVDPKSSQMNKNDDIDKRVVISEIYGGALGRHMTGGSGPGPCMSTFYGKTNITINGGTFDLNTVSDNTSSTSMDGEGMYGLKSYAQQTQTTNGKTYYRAQPGIYAAGAGGFNGIGSDELHTNDLRLPYWDNAITSSNYNLDKLRAKGIQNPERVVRYAPYSTYKGKKGEDKVYITCTDSIVNGVRYTTDIDPAETSTTITINGGNFFPRQLPQGAGIFGAGNGYVNNQLIDMSRVPNPLGGSLLGKPGTTAMELNINGGTFNCDIFGGGRGNDIYYAYGLHYAGNQGNNGDASWAVAPYNVTDRNNPDYDSYGVTLDNYSRNARVLGNVVININGGVFKQNIYGSGSGSNLAGCEHMAEVIGSTTINVNSDSTMAQIFGNIYGGGNYAKTRNTTEININKGYVYGSVFGGGNMATVGEMGTKTYYAANQYYRAADEVGSKPGDVSDEEWQKRKNGVYEMIDNENVLVMTADEYITESGVVYVNGTIHYIGELKEGATGTGVPAGTGHTSVYTKTKEAYVYGDIYGGGNQANVNGDTYVGMTAGHIAGNIYGGGNGNLQTNASADVKGFADVFLNGYTVMWDQMFDTRGWEALNYNQRAQMSAQDILGTYLKNWRDHKSLFVTTQDNQNARFKKVSYWHDRFGGYDAHNIYGGGNLLCNVDSTARVTVTRGMTPQELLETAEWKQSYYDNDNPHFYVFGGGNGERTNVNDTYVNVGMEGVLTQDATADTEDVLAKPASIFIDENGNEISVNADPTQDDNTTTIGIFSNAYGIAGYTVLGVLGGGMNGQVLNNTDVVIGGNTFIHRVYGGGYGKKDRTVTNKIPETTTLGYVGNSTHVTANGGLIYGDIFGGGARGDVGKTTYVEVLRDCKVYGSVYGGGDVAKVNDIKANSQDYATDTVSTVLVGGGSIFRHVFAGGSRGPVYGSTFVNVVDSVLLGRKLYPYIYQDIYGGGESADVYGNSNVLLEGGYTGGDIFGGGLGVYLADRPNMADTIISADVLQEANVTINGGSMLWSERCIDSESGVRAQFDNSLYSIPASRFKSGEITEEEKKASTVFYDWDKGHFFLNHNVYGGGNINSVIFGNTNVTMNHGLVTEGLQYYDQDKMSLFAICWYNTIQNKSYPQFSVLGGGYGEHTSIRGNTNVSMNVYNIDEPAEDAAQEVKDAYAEYKKYKAFDEDRGNYLAFETELKSRWSSLGRESKEELYGGSNANVYRRYRSSRYAWSGGVPGHVMANVYGGSWAGKVEGNANVTIDGTSGCRNVFGGGVGMSSDDKLGEVSGKATVTINGAVISGDVYGGGAGVESADLNDDEVIDKDYDNVARVVNSASVTINGKVYPHESYPSDGTIIFGSVVGGGDVASVGAYQSNYNNIPTAAENDTYVTDVEINGGLIFSPVFAGGSGRISTSAKDYTRLGAVYGNSRVVINTEATEASAPWLWSNVYGGGKNGTVFGSSYVDVNGGNFGYDIFGGGYGVADADNPTDAAVKGNTHVNIAGGEWCISQKWLVADEEGNDVRAWAPVNKYLATNYSPQYDPENKRFNIDHNIYGGGNACSKIFGDTYVKMVKGMVRKDTPIGREYTGTVFAEGEWKESYDKVGSAHFSVFGAGYGENTSVENTHINIDIDFENAIPASDRFAKADSSSYLRFESLQSLLDVIGGGYNGVTNGKTYVHIGKNTYMRRVFAGGYYAPVKESNVLVTSGDIDEVFGGGLIGDVYESTNVQIGVREASQTFDGSTYAETNSTLYINKNVYGGNDVSGTIGYKDEQHVAGQGTHVNLYGGNLYGDVYGGGNGNYLYALGGPEVKRVTPNEHYLKTNTFEGYDLVYTVPMRDGMISSSVASDAQKIVNISTFRPSTIEANIELYGKSAENKLFIKGNVFGGGNAATVDGVVDERGNNSAKVNFNIRDHIDVGGVYLGSDGDAMFVDAEFNPFLSNFQTINGVNLEDTIIWNTDPANHGIKEKYLAVKVQDRPIVYPHLLDLYFQPVEMSIQPTVMWNGSATGNVTDATIGIFCCGGNRGNMNVYPAASGANEGNVVDIKFPDDLVITKHIIGGCNNANYPWTNTSTGKLTTHVGGYLLGQRKSKNPMIRLLVKNKFQPSIVEVTRNGETYNEYQGGNVYGGCYKSGNINGDVTVDLRSNMLQGKRTDYFTNIAYTGEPACNVYGAGYGTNSYVYGDVNVIIGDQTVCETKSDTTWVAGGAGGAKAVGGLMEANADPVVYEYITFNDTGTSANYIFGGGLQGNVVGNTNVRYINGHTMHSVTGGSYAGYLWGSTQVLVGFPEYYETKEQAVYNVKRKDEDPGNLAQLTQDIDGREGNAIKQSINLMKGDIIAPTLYESIVDADASMNSKFTKKVTSPADNGLNWSNINISIDEAIYGGGYSLASGTSVMANNTIVLKYDANHNTDDNKTTQTSVGYGGNTTMVVWDKLDYNGDVISTPTAEDENHIFISKQEMEPVILPDGTDMFGYYYKDKGGHYHYVYQENKYFAGKNEPKPEYYDGTYVSAYNFDAEGGMYGDGHLSFSQGFRTGELKGYGFAGGKTADGALLMNSFQRMDMLRLEDCNVIMLGARDYATNVTNTTPYSIARVGELQMISKIDDSGKLEKVYNRMSSTDGHEGSKGARNFLGLSNNILYLGCVYTNTEFNGGKYHDYAGEIRNDTTYEGKKQYYIDLYYNSNDPDVKGNQSYFMKRNDASAKNMIGISSGYAMKIQNVSSTLISEKRPGVEDAEETAVLRDSVFYGPIVGVAEVNMLSARVDEGGGYIYSDNVHKRTIGGEDFLMTTGNFVFPHDPEVNTYILDDCYPDGYDVAVKNGHTPEEENEIHYWYIEGYNYFYQLHITGYTSDSRAEALKFDADNTDLLTIMKGAIKGQTPKVHSVLWRSYHPNSYKMCDIDGTYKIKTGENTYDTPDLESYPVTMQYQTVAGLSDSENDLRWSDDYYKLLISVRDDTTKTYNATDAAIGTITRYNSGEKSLTGAISSDNPIIALQLQDKVDNTTAKYYNEHLSEPCMATITLTVPAYEKDKDGNVVLDDNNEPKAEMQYATVSDLFTDRKYDTRVISSNYGNSDVTINMSGTTYYYFSDDTHQYEPLDMSELWILPEGAGGANGAGYVRVESITRLAADNTYLVTYPGGSKNVSNILFHKPRNYTYTLYLTIDYVQGPEVRGHIDIMNCALPGEMIRLSAKNVQVDGDESMAAIGHYWRIGMREKDENGNWKFVDDTKWVPSTAADKPAKGYDTYKVVDANSSSNGNDIKHGVFKGVIYDATDNYLLVPAYYFMNGYGVQYGIEFNGLGGQIFPVEMVTADSLLVHNFHRMSTHAQNQSLHLHLSEAVARVQAHEMYLDSLQKWNAYNALSPEAQAATTNPGKPTYVAPLNEPRIYMMDEDDLHDFYLFVDSVGRYDKGNYQTTVQLGNPNYRYPVPTGGKYAQFYLQDNIAFDKAFYHTPSQDFEGNLDGLGHTIDLTNLNRVTDANAPTLLKNVSGHVYNLGVVGKPIAATVAEDDAAHIHNSFVYGKRNNRPVTLLSGAETSENAGLDNCYDLTNAADEDFKYGRLAYNLNSYYLNERYRRGSESREKYYDRIEQYFANEDFQYAHRSDYRTGKVTGVSYLRTGNDDLPAYGNDETRHIKNHAIDHTRGEVIYLNENEAAAWNERYNREYAYEINEAQTRTASPYSDKTVKYVKYHALFNQAAWNKEPGVLDAATDSLRNDYILFGQNLTSASVADTIPAAITSAVNIDAANRVWRASGFYGTKKDEGYFYNAMTNMATSVLDPRITAVDFTCNRDDSVQVLKDRFQQGFSTSVMGAAYELQNVAYAPTADMPTDDTYWRFTVGNDEVTKNLLVYTPSGNSNISAKVGDQNDGIGYAADRPITNIRGHQVLMNTTGNTAALLHLVDKENFNAPFQFVASTAWYDRVPKNETGFVEANGTGWASICLPFTVRQTELSIPIERFYDYADEQANPAHVRNTKKEDQSLITFFYGEKNDNENPNVINHEYWLRSMADASVADGKVNAYFKRPLLSQNGEEDVDNGGGFKAYTPFVVSFPGERFYEFNMDMTDADNNPQTITFSATNAAIYVTDDSLSTGYKVVNKDNRDYIHCGAMMNDANEISSDLKYAIALNDESEDNIGDAFKIATPIYPFRTYIVNAAHSNTGGAKAATYADFQAGQPEVIYIDGLGISLEEKGIEEPETEEVIESNGMRIYPASNRRIVVESTYATTVNVYSASGQLVRVLDVRPGTSIYSGFASGIYVVENKSMSLK